MSDFQEQLRRALANIPAVTPEQAIAIAPRYNEDEADVQEEPKHGFVFDQYDGSSVGFYVEIENIENLKEATDRLKDLVSELEPIQVSLGTIAGKQVFGRVTFHPSGVRPTYFKRRRYLA